MEIGGNFVPAKSNIELFLREVFLFFFFFFFFFLVFEAY